MLIENFARCFLPIKKCAILRDAWRKAGLNDGHSRALEVSYVVE
jgi:hypothetical protein